MIDLTGAYAAIANGGSYNRPVLYTRVYDRDGNILLDNTEAAPERVLKETTAWLLTSAMQDVISSGTGGGASVPNMATAGKTGTINEDRDSDFAGYTPYYTACIWGGYDDNSPQSSTRYSKVVWQAAMARIHEGLAPASFTQPSGIVQARVCSKSGKLAVDGLCDLHPTGSTVYTEYFDASTVPTESCDHHVSVSVCTDTGMIASAYCTNITTSAWLTGVSTNTTDGAYVISDESLANICTIHTFDTFCK